MIIAQLALFIGCVICASCATLPTTPSSGCESSGVHYKPGETFNPSPCEYCRCTQNGRPMCVIQDCAGPQCDNPVWEPDNCCPVCHMGQTCKHTDGTIIKHGEQYKPNPYTTCECTPFRTMAICVAQPQPQTPKPLTPMPLTPKPLTPTPQTPKPISDIDPLGQK